VLRIAASASLVALGPSQRTGGGSPVVGPALLPPSVIAGRTPGPISFTKCSAALWSSKPEVAPGPPKPYRD
jgi:hypothetical protein